MGFPFMSFMAWGCPADMLPVCKQGVTLLLLLAVFLQSFSKAVIFVDFCANQDYIAKNLCENRDRPIIHCYGRCQLNKRLAQDEKQDSNKPERKVNTLGVLLFADSDRSMVFAAPDILSSFHLPAISDCRIIDQPSFCFHPPD